MRRGRSEWALAERIYAALLHLYPRAFRAEYGDEMLRDFREWQGRLEHQGVVGGLQFWGAVLIDLVRSLLHEWLVHLRGLTGRKGRAGGPYAPPYAAAAVAGFVVFALYVVTLAPTVAFWDAGEYITVAHILGIPHPPGNPLFVLLARVWEVLLSPLGLPTAVGSNLFSAALSASAHAFWFLVVDRALASWTEDRLLRRVGAAAAVLLSATAFTVWNQSNVNEKVYTVSFFTTAFVSWLVLRWRGAGRSPRTLLVIGFLIALTATNHLMGVLVAPAILIFVFLVDRRPLLRPRLWLAAVPLVALALSVQFFLPLRAKQRPLVSEGEPVCESAAGAVASIYTWGRVGCEALSAVLQREQYGKPSVLADPRDPRMPRGAALVASQFVNYLQYFDWQWARSIAGSDAIFGGVRPLITVLFLLLGLLGAWTHWRSDRHGAIYLGTLFLTLSAGLVLYLNFKYGYSIATDRFPDAEMHEVRERDYFFLIGFSVWGLWAGIGLAALWREAEEQLRARVEFPRLAAAPVLGLALLPLALNWGWASRADDYTARDWAYNVLMSVEPYGVLVTNGDNDSFPLWYLQKVERIREDVTIVLSPYLNLGWYLKQLRELTKPCPPGADPSDHLTRILCQRPFEPEELPAPLLAMGWGKGVESPEDSIIPLTDEEIDRVAASYYIAPESMTLRAGNIRTTIAAGTALLPADTFAAAILQATLGERPIYFMPGSSHVLKLGLFGHTVRQGVTWKIHNGPDSAGEAEGVVALPRTQLSPIAGAAIDLPLTDTLFWEVFLRRGRILKSDAPWVDAATTSIPMQYVYAHYAAAQAHAIRGQEDATERHVRQAAWWEEAVLGS